VCNDYISDNPSRIETKFQFTSLFNAAWFQTINPTTTISGFRKVGVCPLNAGAIKPYKDIDIVPDENPSSSTSTGGPSRDDYTSVPTGMDKDVEGVEQSQQYDVELFQKRFDNGYDIYDDQLYVDWLRQEHPDCLPGSAHPDVHVHERLDLPESQLPVNQEAANDTPETLPASESTLEGSSSSLSSSLSSTRQLISELKELILPKSSANSKGKGKARVLTSDEALKELIEKEKKKAEEEAKQKR